MKKKRGVYNRRGSRIMSVTPSSRYSYFPRTLFPPLPQLMRISLRSTAVNEFGLSNTQQRQTGYYNLVLPMSFIGSGFTSGDFAGGFTDFMRTYTRAQVVRTVSTITIDSLDSISTANADLVSYVLSKATQDRIQAGTFPFEAARNTPGSKEYRISPTDGGYPSVSMTQYVDVAKWLNQPLTMDFAFQRQGTELLAPPQEILDVSPVHAFVISSVVTSTSAYAVRYRVITVVDYHLEFSCPGSPNPFLNPTASTLAQRTY